MSPAVPIWRAAWPGLLSHLGLAVALGALYVALLGRLRARRLRRYAPTGIGLGFGAVLWVVNWSLISPWVMAGDPLGQLGLHCGLYGGVLAWLGQADLTTASHD